jgi:hypothetical protein
MFFLGFGITSWFCPRDHLDKKKNSSDPLALLAHLPAVEVVSTTSFVIYTQAGL